MVHKLNTVYKTTNLLNNRYYFGVHRTSNPHDSYLGSGTYIQRGIAKHGRAAFRKDILFVYLDAESAFGKENELVETFRNDPLCMNLRKGGTGGFDYINNQVKDDHRSRNMVLLWQRVREDPELLRQWADRFKSRGLKLAQMNKERVYSPEERLAARQRLAAGRKVIGEEEFSRRLSASMRGRTLSQEQRQFLKEWHTGRTHSEETKKKIGDKSRGRKDTLETTINRRRAQRAKWSNPAMQEKTHLRSIKGWETRRKNLIDKVLEDKPI